MASDGITPGGQAALAAVAVLIGATMVLGWARPVPTGALEPPAPRPVDVNRASAVRLRLLPGIGPRRAAAVVVERRRSGPFADLDDLQRVHGIGPATVAGLRQDAIAGPASSAGAVPGR